MRMFLLEKTSFFSMQSQWVSMQSQWVSIQLRWVSIQSQCRSFQLLNWAYGRLAVAKRTKSHLFVYRKTWLLTNSTKQENKKNQHPFDTKLCAQWFNLKLRLITIEFWHDVEFLLSRKWFVCYGESTANHIMMCCCVINERFILEVLRVCCCVSLVSVRIVSHMIWQTSICTAVGSQFECLSLEA